MFKSKIQCVLQIVLFAFFALLIVLMIFASSAAANNTLSIKQIRFFLVLGMPLAVIISLFISFFTVSRIFAYRITGYLFIFVCFFVFFILFYFLGTMYANPIARIDTIQFGKPLFAIMPEYNQVIITLFSFAKLPLIKALISFAYTALFFSSFWGLTRITQSRPLIGALLTPIIMLGAIYLFNFIHAPLFLQFMTTVIKSDTDASIFSYSTGGIVIAITLSFDLLFAYKPKGKRNPL